MRLTQPKTSSPPDDSFPAFQFLILAICRLAEPIAITSIFPYAWLMVQGFGMADASFWAGILIASFSLSEALTSMFWGTLSDRIGRKPVLLLGCFGTMLSLLIVGFSKNFAVAMVGRVLGGVLNGNVGVIQTMVGELVTKPEHEPKAYSIMPFVWSIGTILGPAVGGMLADPAVSYPNTFSKTGIFGAFPWLLPNLVCSIIMFISIIGGIFFLQETHPDFKPNSDPYAYQPIAEHTPMIAAGATADPSVDLRKGSYGTFNTVDVQESEEWHLNVDGTSREPSISEKRPTCWFSYKVAMLILALGIFTYHSMCYDHLLPIFFQDKSPNDVSIATRGLLDVPGGLGLSTKSVGVIMSVNGVIALFIQAVIFPIAAEQLGIWRVFVVVTVLHPVAYFIVPCLALLPSNLLMIGLYACLTIRNLLSILAYPVLLILLKQAALSPAYLGRINGLAASAGAACRTVAPPLAGLLYGWGTEFGFTGLAYWGAGFAAALGVIQLWFVPRERSDSALVRSILPCMESETLQERTEIVEVTVTNGGHVKTQEVV